MMATWSKVTVYSRNPYLQMQDPEPHRKYPFGPRIRGRLP